MKKIWLDLELHGDIDDLVTLVYALENNYNISAISILNGTDTEFKVINYYLKKYNVDIPMYTYQKDIKQKNKLLDLMYNYQNEKDLKILQLTDETFIDKSQIVFGGGAYTIPNYLRKRGLTKFVLQGGFAGSNIVKNPLEKFKDIESIRSWNPNIDMKSTNEMLSSKENIHFISKNICHDSLINLDFVNNMKESDTKELLLRYFNDKRINHSKAMHDLVALLHIKHKYLINLEAVNVDIHPRTHKWFSSINEFSNIKISISWDKRSYYDILLG